MSRVKSRILGNTGAVISEIGFGCGGFWGFRSFPEERAEKLVLEAAAHGVNYFDTGPNYSRGNAEPRLGRILRAHRLDVMVSSKVGSFLDDRGRLVRDFSPAAMERTLTASLRRLHLNALPLLQLHSPNLSQITNSETLTYLDRLKGRGLVRWIGAVADGEVADKAIDLKVFDTLMISYHLLNFRDVEPIVTRAARRGIAVLVKSPMAHGLLSPGFLRVTSVARAWYLLRAVKNYRRDIVTARKLRFLRRRADIDPNSIALRLVLDSPAVSAAIVGTTSLAHLAANLRVSQGGKLDEALLREIAAALA
jgi:aryl-alcohol dehydrogenase-like predicted oxidoreductase